MDCLSSKLSVVNGANGAGKTTYIKMIAINVVVAQIGCFVPARAMSYTPVNMIFCHAGDQEVDCDEDEVARVGKITSRL